MTVQPDSSTLDSQLILVLDDDALITEALAAGLEREGRTVISCNDVESAELMVDRYRPSHVVADVRLSGQFGYEGLEFIRYVRRHAPESRVILMSGDAPDALQLEGSERGAVAFLKKPFEMDELDGVLNLIACSPMSSRDGGQRHIRIPIIDEILSSGALRPFFQPIVVLDGSDRTIAHESLARYRSESPLRNPELLFRYAEKKDRLAELECACMIATLVLANDVSSAQMIFINIHPRAFGEGAKLPETLIQHARLNGVALSRIVLEITEQGSLTNSRATFDAFERLRDLGVRFAFDDVGVAYSHLPLIGKLRPSFLKISQDFGTAFERDPVKAKIVHNIVSLAGDFGCQVILEGIETRQTADAARALRIQFGQGYLFGRPADVERPLAELTA